MSNIASPGIFAVFVVFEHPDGRTLGASISARYLDMVVDLVVFDGATDVPAMTIVGVPYAERKEGEPPTPGTWHY